MVYLDSDIKALLKLLMVVLIMIPDWLAERWQPFNDQWPLLLTWFNFNPSMDK